MTPNQPQYRPMVPLSYYVVTNYEDWVKYSEYMIEGANGSFMSGFTREVTNLPSYAIHTVIWGYKNRPVFIQKTKQVYPCPYIGWVPASDAIHTNETWIEDSPVTQTNPVIETP